MDKPRKDFVRLCRILFPGVLLAANLFSYIQYQSIRDGLIDPYNSVVDIRVLLLLSIANILFLVRFYKRMLNFLFLTIQLILLLFMTSLANSNLEMTVILSSAFMFACGYYLKKPANLIFAFFAGISILGFQQSVWIDNVQTPTVNVQRLLMLGFLFILIIVLDFILSSIIESQETLHELIRNQRNTIVNLVETNVGIQKYALTKKEEFENEERLRITRDIHDTVGYVLTNNITLLRACTYYVPKRMKKAHIFLEDALKNAHTGLNETRSILKKLHTMDKINGAAEIIKIVHLFKESTGIDVKYNLGNTQGTWRKDLDLVFYRIIQEGLVNSLKHGKATRISISFWQTDADIVLNVSDNGKGIQNGEMKEGIGLKGMQERLSPFNGTLDAQSYPHGFALAVRVPLSSIREDGHEADQTDVR